MERECGGWAFDSVCREAQSIWDEQLSRIEVTGGTPLQPRSAFLLHRALAEGGTLTISLTK